MARLTPTEFYKKVSRFSLPTWLCMLTLHYHVGTGTVAVAASVDRGWRALTGEQSAWWPQLTASLRLA